MVYKDSKEEIKAATKKDWEEFKTRAEIAIEKINVQIAKVKGKISKISEDRQQELTNKLERLKRKKDDLKERLAQRNNKFKANMAQLDHSSRVVQIEFEKAFIRGMNELIA